ncbi:NADP oxidoreductase [Robbsia andropogonis]|uniref:NADP oxidoreductase n=1 Tax=Robbsia andropogonis TaxID=28092 RepID=A0A0F5K3T0_9BURK|nr:NAD(P)-binding domain-containing protein [Robbsia andropogonis]KKB64753.1 NADP oxidoreductase [Robbsia andropogonis]MCP1117979.1 NAD(P)-binding domain-containing protein [Robbsia andropogonis]MCP1127444.1 NAD(P)-binding domain-containing protein [Robbsia andropogonis]
MKIGIIGAGFIGRAVAKLSLAAGHDVMVSNSRGPKSLSSIPSGIGCQVGTVEEAASFGNIVLLAIPFSAYTSIAPQLLAGKILMDANNYYPDRDGNIAPLDRHETTTSEMTAKHFASAKVVKTFNAILAKDLEEDGRPAGASDRRALPIAGDDIGAKATVADLLDQMGFDCVDAGSLKDSWRFERAKPAYCIRLDAENLTKALAAAERDVEVEHGAWRQ